MRCDQVDDIRGPYLDGELVGATRAAVESHLAECPVCEQAVGELARVDLLIRNASAPRLSEAERARVAAAIRRTPIPWRRLAAAALIAAALPLGISAWFAGARDRSGPDILTPAIDTSL